jgi:hypothetical protein
VLCVALAHFAGAYRYDYSDCFNSLGTGCQCGHL